MGTSSDFEDPITAAEEMMWAVGVLGLLGGGLISEVLNREIHLDI